MFELISEPLRAGRIASLLNAGGAPDEWQIARPRSMSAWSTRAAEVQAQAADKIGKLLPAFGDSAAVAATLGRVADGRGAVVTTGQQPGLFGGPLYTLYKALSARSVAQHLEAESGVPIVPVFWAATDDADFAEARWTAISTRGGARLLSDMSASRDSTPMADFPIGDLAEALDELKVSCGSAAGSQLLDSLHALYRDGNTVGDAYVGLLRTVLEPLGIAVLDASHQAVRSAAAPFLKRALAEASAVAAAITRRNEAIRLLGAEPQVHEMDDLSLVFQIEGGQKRRIQLKEAEAVLRASATANRPRSNDDGDGKQNSSHEQFELSANVLLRPVVESAILPTVCYVAGPAEMAYFAQSTAVADALQLAQPVAVLRWSGTIVDRGTRSVLERYGLEYTDMASPHEVHGRLARASISPPLLNEMAELKSRISHSFERIGELVTEGTDALFDADNVVEGARNSVEHRLRRFERRVIAAAKRREVQLADDLHTVEGALFPMGKRQERVLGWLPFLARYGDELLRTLTSTIDNETPALLVPNAEGNTDTADVTGAASNTGD